MTPDQLQSSQINELVTAMVAAKKEFKPLIADSKSNYGEYASCDAIRDATEDALGKYGLYFKQNRVFLEDRIMLQSLLSHSSGQWMAAYMPLIIPENVRSIDQAYGSATSYQRRYEAYAMLGLGKGDGIDADHPEFEKNLPMATKEVASAAQIKYLSSLLVGKDDIRQKLLDSESVTTLDGLSKGIVSKSIERLTSKDKK